MAAVGRWKAIYNHAGSERRQSYRASDSMIDVMNKVFPHSDCFRHRAHDVAGSPWSEFCANHVGVVVHISCKKELKECSSKQPECGVSGDVKTEIYPAHASHGMVDAPSARCARGNCLEKNALRLRR